MVMVILMVMVHLISFRIVMATLIHATSCSKFNSFNLWAQSQVVQSKLHEMGPSQLSKAAWGLASLGHVPSSLWMSAFLTKSRSTLQHVR